MAKANPWEWRHRRYSRLPPCPHHRPPTNPFHRLSCVGCAAPACPPGRCPERVLRQFLRRDHAVGPAFRVRPSPRVRRATEPGSVRWMPARMVASRSWSQPYRPKVRACYARSRKLAKGIVNRLVSSTALYASASSIETCPIMIAWRNKVSVPMILSFPIRSVAARRKRRFSSEAIHQPSVLASARHAASPRS